jgi:UDP-N-acetylglucosamine diphosphorylase/glucosamine-1-phosphate N-acetyltransferase
MDTLVLEQNSCIDDLLPFTATRSVLDIRIGILTLREKWERLLAPYEIDLATDEPGSDFDEQAIWKAGGLVPVLPANVLPTRKLVDDLRNAIRTGISLRLESQDRRIRYPWDIFFHNGTALIEDFAFITAGRVSQPIPDSVQAIGPAAIFIEEGARLHHCVLNASAGPIYIGRNAEIMEGSCIRGPFALCEGAVVKMGTMIYGATTIGPYSTVGGEVKNSVIFGYSNKGHDGYLGDSVIGEWCNLGAGTSNSNLKNNAGEVTVRNPAWESPVAAGLKCGLLMGDYSRAAINTSFNTGTVVGVCCNVVGVGLTPAYIPHFSWGYSGSVRYEWDKAIRDIGNWKRLKNQFLTDSEIQILKHIFEQL